MDWLKDRNGNQCSVQFFGSKEAAQKAPTPTAPTVPSTKLHQRPNPSIPMVLSEDEKQFFQRAAARRKENGIKQKLIRMFAEESQVVAFNELYESWVIRWGKIGALDHLIRVMSVVEAKMRDKENETH